jgi:hypothetical protein
MKYESATDERRGQRGIKLTQLRGFSPQATERPALVGEVKCQLFADRGCRVVSATDPHAR